MSFDSEYVNLLIKQYWEKPKAAAEIGMMAGTWRKTFEWIDSFSDEFDLDNATGDRLDIIGRIVGIKRIVAFVVPKIAFGFDENPTALGFDDKFSPLTDTTDPDGIPAHSLWVVVEGGAVSDIVETMVKNKTGGKGMVGAVTGTFSEDFKRPNGTTFTIVHSMTFDRPVDVPVLVRLDATRKDAANPVDEALISQAIAARTFNIGENLLAGDLYRLAFNAGESFIPTNLEISRDSGATYTDGRILSDLNEKFSIAAGDVAVTEII